MMQNSSLPWPFSSLRKNRSAARQRYCCCPLIRRKTSSKCQISPRRTSVADEAVYWIRKRQHRWLPGHSVNQQIRFFGHLLRSQHRRSSSSVGTGSFIAKQPNEERVLKRCDRPHDFPVLWKERGITNGSSTGLGAMFRCGKHSR